MVISLFIHDFYELIKTYTKITLNAIMSILNFVFFFLVSLGGFCIFINLLLSSFYGNPGLATSDSTDNQSAPAVVKFHLYSFPGISLILFFTGLSGIFLSDISSTTPLLIGLGSIISGILISWITGETVTGIIAFVRSKNEGPEVGIRAAGLVIESISNEKSGKIKILVENSEFEADAIEMLHRPLGAGTQVRVIGLVNQTYIVEEVK